ncbi:GH3 family domain-containing protein [Arenibaculum sp.]|uniref:GH3 family domain-containing protein n=1 Tax=Arenibaculum sp. TaxID=2865862 RepID=UPI002E13A412|nr:GH3 auxin-responsive promoter family protein [Arenibaculum sp.]
MRFDGTPLLRLYARHRLRRLASMRADEAQRRELMRLVSRAMGTRFGLEHGFDGIRGISDFQARVPIRRYEDFWEGWWKDAFPDFGGTTWPGPIPYLAATSGTTTGRTKYIPVSREMVAANRRAALDVLCFHLAARPASRVFGGRSFVLGGSTELVEQAPGIRSGDLSGIAAREVPLWAKPWYFPPPELSLIADWDEKVERLGPLSLEQDIRSVSGTASWMLLFFERLAALAPGRGPGLAGLYPHAELIVHGGVDFAPYRERFERLVAGSRAELREVYPASEGFVAAADRGTGEGLRLLADNGLFFEFVPVEELDAPEPRRFWVGNVETGVNYAIVLSSCAGVWAYLLGDTVRFVERDPPRLLVTGRISWTLSAFGEHLIGEEIERAVSAASAALGRAVNDYTVGPVHAAEPGALGGHLYVVEFADGVPEDDAVAEFARVLDLGLRDLNADYRDHRVGRFAIEAPRVAAVPPGTFAAWMRSRGRLGGQNKVPRVLADPAVLDEIRTFSRPSLSPRDGG